ncbi:Mannose-binding lectin superfamily protein [Rhynchospora pubera]|uniref:Mannose-binding lectin superfamily protein n=1 Tax=Rhynchospora pubera TaxID=906938 RepID=A0AAV8C7B7_9POAL|nr:Mannose-binding lectin superfamily protein [Rhynchospora pubera]
MVEAIGVYVKAQMGSIWSSPKPIITKIGPCGSTRRALTVDMDVTDITRIVKVGIRHGASIDGLIVTYERHGRIESPGLWGRENYGQFTEIILQNNEYITNVTGHIAPEGDTLQVRSLKFETNLNTYGPFGTEREVPFALPAIRGQVIGFFGRAGPMLEAIGVYVKST